MAKTKTTKTNTTTKFTASLSVIVLHKDGAKITRGGFAQHIKGALEGLPVVKGPPMNFLKVVVRDVDKP